MTAVDIVYTSCHDAVRGQAGAQGPLEATGDEATKDTPQASGASSGFQSCPVYSPEMASSILLPEIHTT